VLVASLNVFVSFEGFEMNSGYSKTMVNKDRNIPVSYFITIIICAISYATLYMVVNKHLGSLINNSNVGYSLIDLVKVYGFSNYGPLLIIIINIIANLLANLATILALNSLINSYVKDLNL
jgi:amino acid transporter